MSSERAPRPPRAISEVNVDALDTSAWEAGSVLRESLLRLNDTMVQNGVKRTSLDLITDYKKTRIIVLPHDTISRSVSGSGENEDNEFYGVRGPAGWTTKPFALAQAQAYVGYDEYDPHKGATVRITGQSPSWQRGSAEQRYLETLHYNFSFILATHSLAILNVERPTDE